MDIRGKVAVITGGGTGLGREICRQLAAEGMNLAVSYSRSEEEAEETAAMARAMGVKAVAIRADMASTVEAKRLVAEAEGAFGRIDLLIHNAGTTRFIAFPDLDAVTEEGWDALQAVNTRAAFFLAQAAAPVMRRNGGGQIITTSSVAGLNPVGSSIPYAVSKAGLIHVTKCLAVALAPDIRVNSVAPGLLMTRWVAGFSEERLDAMSQRALLKRPTDVPDVAAAFVMLAKNESMTGQVVTIDAGISLS